jgi:phosphate starvation-inducible PhoH-like protein
LSGKKVRTVTNKVKETNTSPPQLKNIKPRTINQKKIFDYFQAEKHIFIHGTPGTGKSFISTYLALNSIEKGLYDRLVIVRSAVPSRKQGFLPGSESEKNEVYEIPYISILNELFDKPNMYKDLKFKGKIEFLSTSFLRGRTIDNAVILVDEIQNMTFMELHTIMTRIGNNCRVILSGDQYQNDLLDTYEESCINRLLQVIEKMPSFFKVQMTIEDICRNPLVREWIIANGL